MEFSAEQMRERTRLGKIKSRDSDLFYVKSMIARDADRGYNWIFIRDTHLNNFSENYQYILQQLNTSGFCAKTHNIDYPNSLFISWKEENKE